MESYTYLLLLALILLSTKVFGLATEKIHMPQVVGALLAGIILGPSGFGVLESTDFLVKTAEIGVIMLMFTAGIDTDLEEVKSTGIQALVIAVAGVTVPLLLCGGLYFFFFMDEFTFYNVLKAAFVGSVFSATSVSITVETLNEMGKLKTRTGTTLLSAALIDDILGIIVLSILSGLSSGGDNPLMVMGRIALFFVFTFVVGAVIRKVFLYVSEDHWHSRRVAVWALAFCLIMAYCAEELFGVADITGAYFAGLILCNVTKSRQFVAKKFTVTSYMVFTPVFFASVGMKTDLKTMNTEILVFALFLVVFAVLSKIVGCGLGGKLCRMSNHQSLVVGIGMVARSEVALMVAQKGIAAGMIDPVILPAIVLSVIASALVTPVLLKTVISRGPELV
ncbi:cation:proton antiporter [Pseudoflavonifractor sp. AF19-9AC]|uniref:cation:proton antiporter n=1 Tax=Pseudoflavonifractor sp. AF19-9AC TaxID=2292244 RepID=UPI000E4F50B3|nr:cation:proton antiporter [Pseudoflavonifractor sp. AF19-9AC]RHR06032.1 cation:proton antiporter [Pseudoflavonifractor sp. AF19-9AC]